MEILNQIGLVILTSLLSAFALFLLTKLMGIKQVSQMTMFDYVNGITIGSIAAELATELEKPLRPLTALIVYGVIAIIISVLTSKSLHIRSALNGKPLVLLEDGVIFRQNLKKARMELSEFLMYCRIAGYFDLSQLQTALVEPNGILSFLPKEPDRPATPSDLNLSPKQSQLQTPFVMDGKILSENIQKAGKETSWVQRSLIRQGYSNEQDIMLALWDGQNKLSVFPKDHAKKNQKK